MLIVVVISVIMSIFVAIQDPIIQKFTIRIAGGYISQKTGTEVQIGRLYISPNFTIHIDHFMVKDLHKNDLLNVEKLRVRPIMEDLIHGKIHVGLVSLDEAQANLITYEGEGYMNFQFLLDLFGSDKKKEKTTGQTEVFVDRVVLNNLAFQLWNQNKYKPEKTEQHLMDYSHLSIDSINLDLTDLAILNDSIIALINHLSANEISGFKVVGLSSKVNVSPSGILLDSLRLQTENSALHLDLRMLTNSFKDIKRFVDSVNFDTKIYPSKLLLSDLGPFAKVMYDMPDLVCFDGLMEGPVRKFKVSGINLLLGESTRFIGDITLQPLNLKDRVQVLNIKRFDYNCEDLAQFYLPIPSKTIPLPSAVMALERGTINGQFNGSMNKFKTSLNVTSEIGSLNLSLDKYIGPNRENMFEGSVYAERFNVGLVANAPKVIGVVDLMAHVTGTQSKGRSFGLDIDGSVLDAQLLGTIVDEIELDGNLRDRHFKGIINIDDNDLKLDFDGLFDFSNPKALGGNFTAEIAHADLKKLHLTKNDEVSQLSASISANMTSLNKFNEAEGTLLIDNLSYTNSSGDYLMKQFSASIVNDQLLQKRINANCDFFDFEMAGKMDFTTLATAFKQYIYSYVKMPRWTADLERFEKSQRSSEQDFIINLTVKNPKPLTKLLMPSLAIAKNTTLNGTFTSRSKSLNLTLRSSYVKFNNIKFNDLECKSISSPKLSVTRFNLNQIVLRDSTAKDSTQISLDQFRTALILHNDSVKANISWDDFDAVDHNKAKIACSYVPTSTGGRFNILNANILLNDSTWTVDRNNFIEIDDDRIQISNISLQSQQQRLSIDGNVPSTASDTLSVALNRFNLATINFLFGSNGIALGGLVTGDAAVSNLKEDPTIFANLGVNRLGINGQNYGDATVYSQWNNEANAIELDMKLTDQQKEVFNLLGSFYTNKKDDNLDFKLTTDSLNIGILSPFLSGIVHRLQGFCTGGVDIHGSIKNPDIHGSLNIVDGGCKVNYLNTYYTFNPTITLSNGLITLERFDLVDTLGNAALVTGNIMHQHLKDFVLDIRLYPNNFLALATNADISPRFYGTAIANGVVKVKGPTNNLTLDIKAMTKKGTVMTIPLGGKSKVKKHEFITFVNHNTVNNEEDDDVVVETPIKRRKKTEFNINLDLNVNDDAQVKISLPNALGQIEARGEGNIKIGLPSASSMSLIGDYVISTGSLELNIQDMLKKNFTLDQGSSISWTGDPVNGTINATGVYQTKASLSSLGLVDSTSMGSSNVKVDCMVHLKNKLLNPDITFGLRLPKASEDAKQAVFNVIDTTNQSEVLVQTVYLMLFNTFNYGSNSTGYVGFLSNQVNEIISRFTNNIDINVNYRPGSAMSNEEMTVAMRKQLFNDRLTIETNFGVIIPTSNYASNSTNIVGDFSIDYKITKDGRLSVQAFNRSNYNTAYYQYSYYKMAPYTQGISLSYNKSFDTLYDLFRKKTNTLDLPNRPVITRTGRTTTQQKNDDGATE